MRVDDHPRLLVSFFLLALLGTLAFSIWCHWPWLLVEHYRLEPMKAVLIWFGDVAVLVWCVWFTFRYCLLRHPLLPNPASSARERRWVLASLLLALGIDLTITILTSLEEAEGKANAQVEAGEIVEGRATVNGKKAFLHCRFRDKNGLWHDGWLQVRIGDQPAALRQAIQAEQFPIPAKVSYDPKWPSRCWLVGYNNEEDNRIHYMSFCFLLFQGLTIPLVLGSRYWTTSAGVIPIYKVCPLLTEIGVLLFSGVCKFLEGEW